MAKEKSKPPVVHKVVMIPIEQLHLDPKNSNKQSRNTFKEIKKSIAENGMDENLLICPRPEGGYVTASGNHRLKACQELGITEVPCVVHEDWSTAKMAVESIRRNLIRGSVSKESFTLAANSIMQDESIDHTALSERLGFADPDAFGKMYAESTDKENQPIQQGVGELAQKARITDDLTNVVSILIDKYGDTVPQSFLIFSLGNKNHMLVQSTPTLKRVLEVIANKCVQSKLDVSVALSGLLSIGMHHTNFQSVESDTTPVEDELGKDRGDSDIVQIKKQ